MQAGGEIRVTIAGAVVGLCLLASVIDPTRAAASFDSCTYDSATREVDATFRVNHDGRLFVGTGGQISSGDVSGSSAPCDGATVSNTDLVLITGGPESDQVSIDMSGPGGPFVKPGTSDEIPIHVDLGDEPSCDPQTGCTGETQAVTIIGTPGPDDIRAGVNRSYGVDPFRQKVNVDASSDDDPDVLISDTSKIEIDGGGGADTIAGLGGSGTGSDPVSLTMRGGPGDDRLIGGGYFNLIYPGAGTDDVIPSPRGGDEISYEDAPHGILCSEFCTVISDGFGATDYVDGNFRTLRGSEHHDQMDEEYGGGPTVLLGGAGNDTLIGSDEAHETLDGGPGNDHLAADQGDSSPGLDFENFDHLYGGSGNDVLTGSADPDYLDGGPGNDVLNGGRGIQRFISGDFRIVATDELVGGPGNDLLNGGPDGDRYEFYAPTGRETDTIREGSHRGRDTLVFNYSELDFLGAPRISTRINLSARGTHIGTSGRRALRVASAGDAANLENVVTVGLGADKIIGNARHNEISTYYGTDTIITRDSGKDTVDCGGGGADTAIVDRFDKVHDCKRVRRRRAAPAPGWRHPPR